MGAADLNFWGTLRGLPATRRAGTTVTTGLIGNCLSILCPVSLDDVGRMVTVSSFPVGQHAPVACVLHRSAERNRRET